MREDDSELAALAAARDRVAGGLTAVTVLVYFGFVLLVAFAKERMATPVAPGLSLGVLLGALVIVASWALTGLYAWWANTRYDPRRDALLGRGEAGHERR